AFVERQVLDAAPGRTTGQLRTRVARAVIVADPQAADKRRRAAEATRDVSCAPDRGGNGTAHITASNLPADQAVAAANRLNALARGLKQTGDPRRLGVIRADMFLALLLGLHPTQATTPTGPNPSTPAPKPNAPEPSTPEHDAGEPDAAVSGAAEPG